MRYSRASLFVAVLFATALLLACPATAYAASAIDTVSPSGTTINLFDYWVKSEDEADKGTRYPNDGINSGHELLFLSANSNDINANLWTGTAAPRTGIVQSKLVDNYPVLNAGSNGLTVAESLSYLFDSSTQDGKKAYLDVMGLLYRSGSYYVYDSKNNFAEFNESTNSFTVYDRAAVVAQGQTDKGVTGQFFPFNSASEVFNSSGSANSSVTSLSSNINHYFGLSMTSRFEQPTDGKATNGDEMTFEFRGDDDALVFIDGVLVGDLGGIHEASTVTINFATGVVTVNPDTNYVTSTTLKEIFAAAGMDTSSFKGNTFGDGTLHTLSFFYLERGGTDSNLELKFNLATVPVSDIDKGDQDGDPVEGAEFELTALDGDNANTVVATGTTNANGELIFINSSDGSILSFDSLYQKYKTTKYKLVETKVPAGYRSAIDSASGGTEITYTPAAGTASFDIGGVIVDSNGTDKDGYLWKNGTYAAAMETLVASETVTDVNGTKHSVGSGGTMFAVVLKRDGSDLNSTDTWHAVYGDPSNVYTVQDSPGLAFIIDAAQNDAALGTNNTFSVDSSGQYVCTMENLPGDITKYYWMLAEADRDDTEYTVAIYYSTASSLSDATAENTVRVNSNGFSRQFSVRLHVTNIKNRLYVQKDDGTGSTNEDAGTVAGDGAVGLGSTTVEGATFALYKSEDVQVYDDGYTITGDPYDTLTTRNLTISGGDPINLDGGGVFPDTSNSKSVLEAGTYYLVETSTPSGYDINSTLTKVVVDSTGVHVDAGTAGDGVQSFMGPGRVVSSLSQFASMGEINDTLTWIKGTWQTGKLADDGTWTWTTASPSSVLHMKYNSSSSNSSLQYVQVDQNDNETGRAMLYTDVGWSRLLIQQDEKATGAQDYPRAELGDKELNAIYECATGVLYSNQRLDPSLADFSVTKQVTKKNEGDTAPDDAEFTIKLTFFEPGTETEETSGATYKYLVGYYDASGTFVQENAGSVATGGTVTLKAGQTLYLFDLAKGRKFKVEETGLSSSWQLSKIEVAGGNTTSTVEIADDALSGSVLTERGATADDNKITFTNEYQGVDVSTASFSVTKAVGADDPVTTEFTFQLNFYSRYQNSYSYTTDSKEYEAVIRDASGAFGSKFKVKNGDTVKLKANETLYVFGLSEGSRTRSGGYSSSYTYTNCYKITETNIPDNWIFSSVTSGNTSTAMTSTSSYYGYYILDYVYGGGSSNSLSAHNENTFTNSYEYDPATTSLTFATQVALKGRAWGASPDNKSDTYRIYVQANSADAPAPDSFTADETQENTWHLDVTDDNAVRAGTLSFPAAGTYTYTIWEETPADGLLGITYSKAKYQVSVTVELVSGQYLWSYSYLSVTNFTMTQLANDDGTETNTNVAASNDTYTALFTNTYKLYGLRVHKQATQDDGSYVALAGAEFELLTSWDAAAQTGTAATGIFADLTSPTATTSKFTTDASGDFSVYGLAAGTYYLRETKAPSGYTCLSDPFVITVNDDGSITYNGATLTELTGNDRPSGVTKLSRLEVTNSELASLPYAGTLGGRLPVLVIGLVLLGGGAYVLCLALKRTRL